MIGNFRPPAFLKHRYLMRLLPSQRCLCCDLNAGTGNALCDECRRHLPVNQQKCDICSLPMEAEGICGICLQHPPAYNHIVAPFVYDPPISQLVSYFKHQANFAAGLVLSELMVAYLKEQILKEEVRPDLLFPIPLHWRRQWERGFNQSAWLVKRLAEPLGCCYDLKSLRRRRYESPQQLLPRKQRLNNLKGSFFCSRRLDGLHAVVVDDVVTTGATAQEAAHCLLAAGAEKVDVWCLARTPVVR